MIRGLGAVLGTVALLSVAGCGSDAPDYQSIWSTAPATTAASTGAADPDKPVPFSQYLEGHGVQGEPVDPGKLTDITVTLPRPQGWGPYENENLSPQTLAIAKNNNYPTATVLAFRLHGGFDVDEAIKHANADALMSTGFTKLNESFKPFGGFPSAMIEGSYTGPSGKRLHSYSRVVIPVTPGPAFQRYLVQLTVTSEADKAVVDSTAIEQIIGGFKVTVP